MRAATLKMIAGAVALVVGGIGISMAVRAQRPVGRHLTSPRTPGSQVGRPLVVTPDRVTLQVPKMPVSSAPPLQAARPEVGEADSLTSAPWEPALSARPVTSRPAQVRPHGSSVTARPRSSRLRLPATAMAVPAGRPVTGMPARATPRPVSAAPPVTSPGSFGFREELIEQRNPIITMANMTENGLTVSFRGPKVYKRRLAPGATAEMEIEAGEYRVRVASDRLGSCPNSGRGVFREFTRYTARWFCVLRGQARPLRLGELSRESTPQEPEPADVPEPLVKPMPE